jgi:hypothetical protein
MLDMQVMIAFLESQSSCFPSLKPLSLPSPLFKKALPLANLAVLGRRAGVPFTDLNVM